MRPLRKQTRVRRNLNVLQLRGERTVKRETIHIIIFAAVVYFLVTKFIITPELVYGNEPICPPGMAYLKDGMLFCG